MNVADIIAPVILCGGSGSRLWPVSQISRPKQFLKLVSDKTMLQDTLTRALAVSGAPPDRVISVTASALKEETSRQLGEIDAAAARHVLAEPFARNTAAAVAYAALYVRNIFGPGAAMWVLPADHHVGDESSLEKALNFAKKTAQDGYIITFGVRPTRAETGYGYIHAGEPLHGNPHVLSVHEFAEKPDQSSAESYIASGKYLWNSGMFFFHAETVLRQYREYAPDILESVENSMDVDGALSPERYKAVRAEPFDKAILEKSSSVAVAPCEPEWSDLGSWESIWEISGKDGDGNAVKGEVTCVQTRNCLIHSQKRLVACAGVQDIVVAETEGAILVADLKNGAIMRMLTEALKRDEAQRARTVSLGIAEDPGL